MQGSDGSFYGTTSQGGVNSYGTVFRIGPDGGFTKLYSFSGNCDGVNPTAGVILGSDGNLYGTTCQGGTSGDGTVFKLSIPCTISTISSPPEDGTTSGGGTVICGTNVTVCAVTNPGYSFVNWAQNSDVVSTSACYTFMATSNRTLVANFAPLSYTISTSSSPPGGGTTGGGGTVNYGSSVTVTATANPCYSFVSWTENGTVVSTSSNYTFTANASRALVANFSQLSYTITTRAMPGCEGTTSGDGPYACGANATVSATRTFFYNFLNWTEGTNVVSASPDYTFSVSTNRSLVANFTQQVGVVTFQVNMAYQIAQGWFTPSNRVCVRGTFNGWGTFDLTNSGGGVYGNTTTITGAPGATVYYRYWNNGNGGNDNWEGGDNRSFTLAACPHTLPARYFNDVWGGGPPIAITFQVDMSVQTAQGTFNPASDLVEARGSFQSPNPMVRHAHRVLPHQ